MPSSSQPHVCFFRPGFYSKIVVLVLAVVFAFAAAAPLATQAQTYTVLHTFRGNDGANPVGGVIVDPAGNLYGTTSMGGADTYGVLFRIDKNDEETVAFSFDGVNGEFPGGSLARDNAGNLYGTADEGTGGAGVVYKVTANGDDTVLYDFQGGLRTTTPKGPSSVIVDASGMLYGTTIGGGNSQCSKQAVYCGTIFKLDQAGNLTVLYSFTGGPDGAAPMNSMIMDKAGNLYGTTYVGGDPSCKLQGMPGCGTVFKLDPTGKLTVLHTFHGSDGAFPLAGGIGLVPDAAGNIYGTAGYGGKFGQGVIFSISKTGKYKVLYNFTGNFDSSTPNAGLAIDPEGNLYGTTQGGSNSFGNVFELSSTGTFTVLHALSGGADGAIPFAGLVRDSTGNLYGTTYKNFNGLEQGKGTVFKVTP